MGSELKDRTSYDFTGLHPELYPQPELVREHMVGVTLEAGVAVAEAISQFIPVPDGEKLSERNKKIRVELLDTLAAARFEDYLKGIPFKVLSVASEGEKEWAKMGRAMPTVLGEHGRGEQMISIANDVVEGTTAASHNRPGAISVLAASTYGGIMPTPKGVKYMEKFFAPPETKGYVDIRYPMNHNFEMIRTVYGVPAHEINVVSMKRDTNAGIHEAARKFGANLHLIDAGDLMPSLLAITSPHKNGRGIYIVAGRGGMEEGIIAAVGAKALGAHAQGREWRESPENKDFPIPGGKVFSLDEMVRGKREHSLVTFTPITDDKWFDFPGVKFTNGSLDAHAVLLDMNGFQVIPHHKDLGIAA